jgi:2'-5' RNA ligase
MRVFAALPPSQSAMQALELVLAALTQTAPRLRTVKPTGIHLTLHFFGELSDAQAGDLVELWKDTDLHRPEISAHLGGLGCFPERGSPRVVWVGIEKAVGVLRAYSALFESKIAPLGYREDPRGFTPHITLARNSGERLDNARIRDIVVPGIDFHFRELVLFQSILKPGGAEYAPLARLAFTGDAV